MIKHFRENRNAVIFLFKKNLNKAYDIVLYSLSFSSVRFSLLSSGCRQSHVTNMFYMPRSIAYITTFHCLFEFHTKHSNSDYLLFFSYLFVLISSMSHFAHYAMCSVYTSMRCTIAVRSLCAK